MLCKCHWIVLYIVHFTAFCLGGRFFPDTVYNTNIYTNTITNLSSINRTKFTTVVGQRYSNWMLWFCHQTVTHATPRLCYREKQTFWAQVVISQFTSDTVTLLLKYVTIGWWITVWIKAVFCREAVVYKRLQTGHIPRQVMFSSHHKRAFSGTEMWQQLHWWPPTPQRSTKNKHTKL